MNSGGREMDIKVLGTGCAKCHQLEKTAREVVKELGINATVEEVKDMRRIAEYHVLMTPGLVVNGEVVSSGHVPNKGEVTKLLMNALTKEGGGQAGK
jgi:small redox-active disulfide protein 2